ncbi:MAG: hypothetical protein ACXAAI_12980 [Promethearchaeota archaeon]|jgi:hypothetical protein
MTENIDLKDLEKKAWRSTFQDGLLDICFGLLFLGMGIYTIPQLYGLDDTLSLIMILMGWNFSSVALFIIGKKLITIPRIGYVKFGKERVAKRVKLTICLLFMVGLTIVLLLLPLSGLNIRLNGVILMLIIGTLFITFPICVVAYFLQFERLYLIAIMGGLGLSFAEFLRPIVGSPLHNIITFCTIGGIVIAWGTVFFIRFIKEYPSPKRKKSGQFQEVKDG